MNEATKVIQMSYLGTIGHLMQNTGLNEALKIVYGGNTVRQMSLNDCSTYQMTQTPRSILKIYPTGMLCWKQRQRQM